MRPDYRYRSPGLFQRAHAGVKRAARGTGKGERQAGGFLLHGVSLCAAVRGGGDADIFPGKRHVLSGYQVRAVHRQIMTCAERDIAVYGTDGAAAMGHLLRIIRYLQALAAVADTDAARAGEAGFFSCR